jgi:uncharacterized protein Yka (UPF0111/DUF47 family)
MSSSTTTCTDTTNQHLENLKTRCAEMSEQLEKMESVNQEQAFKHSQAVHAWRLERDEIQSTMKQHLKVWWL